MDAIALEAGVGKMTVYRQYTDKHTLFIACMNDQCREMLVPDRYESAASLDEAESMLIDYGHIVVDLITRRDIVMLFRMMIGEINRFNGLGDVFYRGGPGQAISVIERILGKLFPPRRRDCAPGRSSGQHWEMPMSASFSMSSVLMRFRAVSAIRSNSQPKLRSAEEADDNNGRAIDEKDA